jgi:hypothetical protein
MTTIRRIVTSKIDGSDANNTTDDEIRPFGEINVYIDNDSADKLVLAIHDGVRTHLKSKVLEPGVFYGSNADASEGQGVDTIKLIPDAALYYNNGNYGNDQYLVVDPTQPNHIHIRAGGTIDNSNAALFLGGENSNVEIQAGENPPVYVRANNNTWMFDVDGSLTFPSDLTISGDRITGRDPVQFIEIETDWQGNAGSRNGSALFVDPETPGLDAIEPGWIATFDGGLTKVVDDAYLDGGQGFFVISFDSGSFDYSYPVTVASSAEESKVEIAIGTNVWQFSEGGNLTLPAASDDFGGSGQIFSNSGNNFINLDVQFASDILGGMRFGTQTDTPVDIWAGGNGRWRFGSDGSITFPDDTVQTTAYVPDDNLVKVSGEWAVTAGTNTYSFTVPSDGTYIMWVKGNIPNGIITWNATASVSNNNVPAIGTQYAWNYTGGTSPILLTSIPDQIKGVAGTISTDATYAGTTSNRFDFGISNTSGSTQTIYYGYTKIS